MHTYKVLSIQQPWAHLVCIGAKTIETRSWPTNYKGEVLIHSSADPSSYFEIMSLNRVEGAYHFKKYLSNKSLCFGAIIGKAIIWACDPTDEIQLRFQDNWERTKAIEELAFGDYRHGRFGWYLSNPVLFDEPIKCKGQLRLWNYSSHKQL